MGWIPVPYGHGDCSHHSWVKLGFEGLWPQERSLATTCEVWTLRLGVMRLSQARSNISYLASSAAMDSPYDNTHNPPGKKNSPSKPKKPCPRNMVAFKQGKIVQARCGYRVEQVMRANPWMHDTAGWGQAGQKREATHLGCNVCEEHICKDHWHLRLDSCIILGYIVIS